MCPKIAAFFPSQDVHLHTVEMLALRHSCVTPSSSPSSNHHHQHPLPYYQSDFDYVNPHPHHHRMLKVVVMFALRRSRPTHHTDRWHRLQRQYRTNKVCATPQRNQVLQGVEIPAG